MLDAGDADIEEDGSFATADELDGDVPVEEEFSAPIEGVAQPDIDSTMVYGAGGAVPGHWPETALAGDTPAVGIDLRDDREPQRS